MSALPGGRVLKFEADTVIRFTRMQGIEPKYMTFYVRKNRVNNPMPGQRLETCSASQFQVAVPDEIGRNKWHFMGPYWSTEAEPGNYVRRRWSECNSPDGMVIAVIQPQQLENESHEFLILWFR